MKNKIFKYCQILEVDITASKLEIKRAYRKKALIYHPDKNQTHNSEEAFIRITEAYEFLIAYKEGRVIKEIVQVKEKTAEEVLADRMARARARYRKNKLDEKLEEEAYFNSIFKGKKGQRFKIYGLFSLFFSLIWIIDIAFLPLVKEKVVIESANVSSMYASFLFGGNSYFFSTSAILQLSYINEVVIQKTFLFKDVVTVGFYQANGDVLRMIPKLSFIYVFPLVQLVLFIPFLTYLFRNKTPFSTLFHMVSTKIVPIIFLLSIFSRMRIFQLFFW